MNIRIDHIDLENSHNASREKVFPEDCMDLARSMEASGQRIPIGVRPIGLEPVGGKYYNLVYGFRRITAAQILGWKEIKAVEVDGDCSDGLTNLLENLMRQDLTLWEECVALKNEFPDEVSNTDIAKAIGYSRTWVRARRRVWDLDKEIQLQVERGELSATDLMALTQLSPEEQQAKAEMLAKAKAEGQSTRERTSSIRRHPRSIKQLRRIQSQIHDAGREDWNALVLFALGEIEDDELFGRLDYRPTI